MNYARMREQEECENYVKGLCDILEKHGISYDEQLFKELLEWAGDLADLAAGSTYESQRG